MTGCEKVIVRKHMEKMKNGAVLCMQVTLMWKYGCPIWKIWPATYLNQERMYGLYLNDGRVLYLLGEEDW